jgi:lipopolysaccharide transport system ATP-binding protein
VSDIAIKCEGLSKQYRIGERESYKALRDVLTDAATAPFRRLRSTLGNGNGSKIRNPKSEVRNSHFWALDDVSFEVKRGEVVGIIGRNGAGKSTLLKILSRITRPTRGTAEIHGRVGSLLEVGTGFHPELTGRENIYLNGAILGMRKAEIERKFDEIVAFAEVEQFIDTPVKRYSSGMHVRLAFAVAAHMETEILLVDEVLAVGDAAFQRKCLGKMGDVARHGRTVLFVSHQMGAVTLLCPRAILLDTSKIRLDGESGTVVESYLNKVVSGDDASTIDLRQHSGRHAGCRPILSQVKIINCAGQASATHFPGDDLILEFDLDSQAPINEPTLGVGIDNMRGTRVFSVTTYYSRCDWQRLEGQMTVRCTIPSINLVPGRYFMSLSVGNIYNTLMDAITHAASFTIQPNDFFGTGKLPPSDLGVVMVQSRWEFEADDNARRRSINSKQVLVSP